MGFETILSEGEEKLLANSVLSMGRKRFPVQQIYSLKRQTGFKDRMRRKTWFAAFLRRHPEIIKKGQSLLQNHELPSLKLIQKNGLMKLKTI